jgi:uncharacterized protein
MALHPVLFDELTQALKPRAFDALTLRDTRLPAIPNKTHAIIGMRRAGKTSYLHQLMAEARQTIPPERAFYISFDDDRLAGMGMEQLSALFDEYYRRYPDYKQAQTLYCFLDEIQLVTGWERVIRRLMDTENIQIIVSGSSAKMLSREVHTSLRGRGMETIIRPFSFPEFLRHHAAEVTHQRDQWTSAQIGTIEKWFSQYLKIGGFPEAQSLEASVRINLLQSYVDTVLFRDVIERYQLRQIAALRWLTRHCLRNPAGSLSVHRLYLDLRAQGHSVSKDALHDILIHLQDAFLISAVPIATESERQKNSNPRKIYPADHGLVAAFDSSGRSNTGHALECVVYTELSRRKKEISYVKTPNGFEVDFLIRYPGEREELIQVCADIADDKTLEREIRALDDAGLAYPKATKRLLTMYREIPKIKTDVIVQPTYEWLFEGA